MIVVESQGSMWYLDEQVGAYRRAPKQEGPRSPGPWREPEPGDPLFDLEPHPMLAWAMVERWPDRLTAVNAINEAEVRGGETHRDFISRCMARAQRYSVDSFPMLFVLVTEDGNLVSAPNARQVHP